MRALPEFRWNHGSRPALSLSCRLGLVCFLGVFSAVKQPNQRDPALDVVRAVAILMVVTIHTASSALYGAVGTARWWTALFWGSLVRPAVPLFFMCTGALFLPREISLKKLYGKNFLRIVLVMLFWATVAKLYRLWAAGFSAAGLWQAVQDVLLFRHESHFYYLHLLLLVYAFLPLLQSFVRGANRRSMIYALSFWGVTGILLPLLRYVPPFSLMYPLEGWYMLNMAYSSIGYVLLGHCMRQYAHRLPRWVWTLCLTVGAVCIFAGTGLLSLRAGTLVEILLEGWSVCAMLIAVGVFGLAVTAKGFRPLTVRLGESLSRASLCIYLIHGLFLEVLERVGLTANTFLPLISVPVIVLVTVALNRLVYEVLRRIPVVRTWLV